MRATTLLTAVTSAALVGVSQWSVVHAGFFVCPSPCEAMLLPRDMESIEDCLCNGQVATLADNKGTTPGSVFRCPTGSAATRLRPMSFADCACAAGFTRDDMRNVCTPNEFQCIGRYRLKSGVTKAKSIADCDCQAPYKKDEASGACVLKKCPRAGNYVKKLKNKPVNSLADCACVDPFTKNDQSGECLVLKPYDCPRNSQPAVNRRPTSFADCHCDWGFVRSAKDTCVRESTAFACPNHAVKRPGLGIHERPRSFADCECENNREFFRNDKTHQCERRNKDVDGDGREEIEEDEEGTFTCPPYARPLALFPYSIEQCECLPGYGWKTPEMTCVPLSAYECPPHAFKAEVAQPVTGARGQDGFKADDSLQAERSFSDCECARGYYRDEAHGACLEWFLANDNGCPDYAYLRHWPLQSKANCQCIYGLATGDAPTTPATEENNDDNTPLRQRKSSLVRKAPTQCNAPPSFFNTGFSQCPDNAVAISWPIASPDDCACKDGFDILPISESMFRHGDGEGFRCVDPTATITRDDDNAAADAINDDADDPTTVCKAPLVKNVFTGDCRLPVEQVRPRSNNPNFNRGSVVFKGIEYDYVLTDDDIMIIQGDVAIGELARWPAADGKPEITTQVLHGYYNAERDHRWEDATLCYEIDATASAYASTVEAGMKHIANVTNFKFQRCRNNNCALDTSCAHDFVSVTATASSCWSYIGRIGGRQALGVSSDCGLGNIIHVLLHAIGLRHTIDRPDRDDHVTVAWECIPETRRSFFIVEDVNVTDSVIDAPYDFFSIMHHPPDAFVKTSEPWCQSVIPVIAEPLERMAVMGTMGQRELLAVTDIHAVWRLYPALQAADKAPTYISSAQATGDTTEKPAVFESRLHTQDDVVNTDPSQGVLAKRSGVGRSWGRKLASFVGALVTLTGFGAFVAFGVVEFRRRAQLQGSYYSESLLTDKSLYD